jgi:hypothetical protein
MARRPSSLECGQSVWRATPAKQRFDALDSFVKYPLKVIEKILIAYWLVTSSSA